MLLKFGTPCRSRGELLGTLWGVTVEPGERLLLRLVVEEPQAEPLVRVRVPFSRIEHADGDQVALSMTAAEVRACPHHETESLRGGRRKPGRRRRGEEPPERLLTARARVLCRDDEVGQLVALTVDSRTGDIEDLGFPFGVPITREVVVAASHVEEIRDDRVVLKISMDDLGEFPSRRTSV